MTTFEHNALTEQSVFIPLGFVDIGATLDGGQAFRWHLDNSGYRGIIGRRVVHISQVSGGVVERLRTVKAFPGFIILQANT